FRLFSPFIRDASTIEFCDRYLFINPNYDDDVNFLFNIVSLTSQVKKIKIFTDTIEYNRLHELFLSIVKGINSELSVDFINYNSNKNHDRFIIVDEDKISIRFSTSFNNFRRNQNGIFKVKDNCSLVFTTGRNYID
ncbi:MAG: hypothetical protein N3A56_08355, partial [Thermodesulfobacteriaceae bacterium]|nr:hypothetical protein [Thermodesulfobacteriaceae bacterium]